MSANMRFRVTALGALRVFARGGAASAAGDAAEAKLKQGTQAFRAGRYDLALERFTEALDLASSPRLEFNVAETLLALKREAEAADAFDAFLEHGPMEQADFRDEARRQIAALGSRTLEVTLTCAPPAYDVIVDGERRAHPRPASRFRTAEGPHDVRITRADTFVATKARVDGRRGQLVSLSLCAPPALTPTPPTAPTPALVASPREERASPLRRSRVALIVGAAVAVAAAAILIIVASRPGPPSSSLGNYPL
jgi:hypothetical protein